jgi:hypothetical protein
MKNFLIGILILPSLVGTLTIYHTLLDSKPNPLGGELTNRIARAELVWLAMNKPKLFVDQFPQLAMDVEARHGLDERQMLLSDAFDPEFFVAQNPDVPAAILHDRNLVGQYWLTSLEQCRQGSAHFNVQSYIKRYPDINNAYNGDCRLATMHWVRWGKSEGRKGTAESGIDMNAKS